MQSRYRIWRYIFCLLLFALMSYPLLAQDDGEPVYSEEVKQELEGQNCAVPISSLGGQGHQISGVEAELTTLHPQTSSLPTLIPSDPESGATMTGGTGVAAVLVVDSFNDVLNYDLTFAINATDQDQIDKAVANGEITHGAVVMNHINSLLYLLGFKLVQQDSNQADWLLWQKDDINIVVMKVDAVSYGPIESIPTTTQQVNNAIEAAITSLRNDVASEISNQVNGMPINRFVVNMSFAILPCAEVIDFYNQGQEHSFDDYFKSIGISYEQLLVTVLQQGEPLTRLFTNDGVIAGELAEALIGVASSGNSGLAFPFAPAIFPVIFSVSAQSAPLELMTPRRVPLVAYANAGEFIENGGWIQLVNPAKLYAGPEFPEVFYLGTSFSGPALSTSLALELTEGVDVPCVFNGGNVPTVAYAGPVESQILNQGPGVPDIPTLLSSGIWGNIDFQMVRQGAC